MVKIKAYAKVNLTLEITGVKDGFHELDSLVASVDLYDLIMLKKRKNPLSCITMRGMGSESIPPDSNNALKAAEAFSKRFGVNGADITVYKNIPIGAGLGGSSADISGVLLGMAKLYQIDDFEAVASLADELGSDTRYMLQGGFARMRGRGNLVEKLPSYTTLHMLLLCPESTVSSGACYRRYDELFPVQNGVNATENCKRALAQKDTDGVGRYLMNDLFEPAQTLNEDVGIAYRELLSFSPLGVTMTGSGSAVFAVFETKELCEWAKSRYRGKYRSFVLKTVVPTDRAQKKPTLKNPFVLTDEERALGLE